jgi:xylan 1,4-beta-xylosidase
MYPLKSILDSGIRKQTDIGAMATKDKKYATVMIWNYHDEDKQGAGSPIEIKVSGLPKQKITLTQYRIDNEHSNSYEAWKKMASPQSPTTAQISVLEKAGQLQTMPGVQKMTVTNGVAVIRLSLPRQGVALVKMDW